MKHMKKIFVFSAILLCVVFLGMKFYDSYISINAEGDYTLKGEPNTYHETISANTNGTEGDYTLRGEPNTYYATFSTNAGGTDTGSLQALSNGCSVDYVLRGELNTYYETFPAISNDIDSYNSEEMHSDDIVIAEPTPLPKQ